jgi:HD-like signal output (HDOD) protein
MRSVLFVDDDTMVLEGLALAFRRYRQEWTLHFASGYDEAVAVAESQALDAVVSDVRMPGPGGVGLLRYFRQQHPLTARLALTGQTSAESARELTSVAHRFLTKPTPPDVVYDAVERICALQALLANDALRELVGRIGHLPPLPRTYERLRTLLPDPDAGAARIASVIESDPGLAAKLLHVVNSGFFGRSYTLRSLEHAVTFLGIDLLERLVLSLEVLRQFRPTRRILVDPDALGQHGLLAARLTRTLIAAAPDAALRDERRSLAAATAALLHQLGILVLEARAGVLLEELAEEARNTDRPLLEIERERLGTSHDQVGAYLLGLWGFPLEVVEAVARMHHAPGSTDRSFDVLDLLRLAGGLADELVPPWTGHRGMSEALMKAAAERLGLDPDLGHWRDTALRIHTELQSAV